MPLIDPKDFRDDGGTPAWRANQETWKIGARRRGFRAWWRRAGIVQIILATLLFWLLMLLVMPAAALLAAYLFIG